MTSSLYSEMKVEKLKECNAQLKDVIQEKQHLQTEFDLIGAWSEWSSCSKKCWGTKTRILKGCNGQINACNQFPTCHRSGK